MIGMGSMLATTEMHRRAEEIVLRVRSELFRSCSRPDNFAVQRHGFFLQMTYLNQTIFTDPYEVWIVLRKMNSELDDKEIWERISAVRQIQTQNLRKSGWGIGLLMVGLILAFFMLCGSPF